MSFSRRQAKSVSALGIHVRSFYLNSRTSLFAILKEVKRLRVEIREFAPDVVHAHFGTMTALVAAIASRTKLVITFHGSDLNPAPGAPWLRSIVGRALSHIALRRSSHAICVSPQLRERISYMKDRAHVVPCGVNMNQFRPMPKAECRAKLGWPNDAKIVLFNARTDPIGKRLDLAEAAYSHAHQKIPNLLLHVFRGQTHPDEMPLYYSAADCLLLTSDFEGSPMVIKEALACNLPIVSVNVGDVAERLSGVVPSSIVARDPLALAEAIVQTIELNCLSNGREMMAALAEDAIAKKIASIYQLALGGTTNQWRTEPLGKPSVIRRERELSNG